MSRSAMKNRVLLLAAASLVAVSVPSIVANADDVSGFATGDWEYLEASVVEPVMPDVGFDAEPLAPTLYPAPAVAPVAPLAAPGGNPFQAVASIAPTLATPAAPLALGNPFAPTTPVLTGKEPDAKPFSLLAPTPTTPDGTLPNGQPGTAIDETALRYYAVQRDMPRVGAEIRRLKSLYPDWEPPVDLFVEPSSVNEQPLWDLFASGQFAAERAKIIELKGLNPNWVPSTDLMTKLEDAEARQAMKVAYNAGNWEQVVAVGQSRGSVLVCSQIEPLWQVGESLARMRNYAMSFEIYKYALVNCGDPVERLSTVQKAAKVLPPTGISALVLLGRPLPDGTSEFDSIGFNDLRHRISAAINEDFDVDPVDPSEMERFAAFVRATRTPDDIGLIGWYYYSMEEWNAARAWFALGAKISKSPKFLEGQVLSLRSAGEIEPALKLANMVKARSPELTKEYIELVSAIITDPDAGLILKGSELKTFEDVVLKARSALGAQAIGWNYVADEELADAEEWFDTSMAWEITEGGVIGRAVVASRLQHFQTLSTLKANYGDEFEDLDKFKIYTVKTKKKTASGSKKVTQATVECKAGDKKSLGLFFVLACPRN